MDKFQIKHPNLCGQSLIELLIAIGVASLFITGITTTIEVALRSSISGKEAQSASYLGQELVDAVTVIAHANWSSIAQAVGNAYVVSPNTVAIGQEQITINGVVYTRFFTVASVLRDVSGNLDTGVDDPSTKRILVTVQWLGGGPWTVTKLITRHAHGVFLQTDWFGGSGQRGIISDIAKFDTQSGIDASQSGSLKLLGL